MLDFNCDRRAKCDFTASTANYLRQKWGSDFAFYESDKEGNLVPFGSEYSDIHSHMDLYIVLYSAWTAVVTYAVELKERQGRYTSKSYGEEGQEGWMYNIPKDTYFKKEMDAGRKPLFANLYPDSAITIWNIAKISPENIGSTTKMIKGINIDPLSPKREQERLLLMNKDGITIPRIQGDYDEQGDS